MTVCRFYQQGYCRNGNACHFEHERPQTNKYSYHASPLASDGFGHQSPMDEWTQPPSRSQHAAAYHTHQQNYRAPKPAQSQQLPSFSFTQLGARTVVAAQPKPVQQAHANLPTFSFVSPGHRIPIRNDTVQAQSHSTPSVRQQKPANQQSSPNQMPSFNFVSPKDQHSVRNQRTPQSQTFALPAENLHSSILAKTIPRPQQPQPMEVSQPMTATNHPPKSSASSFKFELPSTTRIQPTQNTTTPVTVSAPSNIPTPINVSTPQREIATTVVEPSTILTSQNHVYSLPEELKSDDLNIYRSTEPFLYGKIPVRPPPTQLCR